MKKIVLGALLLASTLSAFNLFSEEVKTKENKTQDTSSVLNVFGKKWYEDCNHKKMTNGYIDGTKRLLTDIYLESGINIQFDTVRLNSKPIEIESEPLVCKVSIVYRIYSGIESRSGTFDLFATVKGINDRGDIDFNYQIFNDKKN